MNLLRGINTLLLAGILAALILILLRMPPTFEDLSAASAKGEGAKLLQKRPLVYSEVNLPSPLPVEIENSPLDVNVENDTLKVEIEQSNALPVFIIGR